MFLPTSLILLGIFFQNTELPPPPPTTWLLNCFTFEFEEGGTRTLQNNSFCNSIRQKLCKIDEEWEKAGMPSKWNWKTVPQKWCVKCWWAKKSFGLKFMRQTRPKILGGLVARKCHSGIHNHLESVCRDTNSSLLGMCWVPMVMRRDDGNWRHF